MKCEWQPSANKSMLLARAELNKTLRAFFSERSVMEVEVPLIGRAPVTDPYINALMVENYWPDEPGFLQTSPEYFMKRLLAAGSGDIYSLAKCFRAGESGRRHNPEFTMLEWYRVGFDDQQLMVEVADLLQIILPIRSVVYYSYRQLFAQFLDIDPMSASNEQLSNLLLSSIELNGECLDRDTILDLLITHHIEPKLFEQHGNDLVFIHDYPASQAALSKIQLDRQGQFIARRFEGFYGGFELCNGYWELTDAKEQRQRFVEDQAKRKELGLPEVSLDEQLMAAIEQGLPECAGVALGVDRLLLLQQKVGSIAQTISFAKDSI